MIPHNLNLKDTIIRLTLAFALIIGANYMLKTLIMTDQEDKIELANFYINNLLPFCNVESSIATLGVNNLYENVNSIF